MNVYQNGKGESEMSSTIIFIWLYTRNSIIEVWNVHESFFSVQCIVMTGWTKWNHQK